MLNDPLRAAEYLETPWRLEVDRVLWQHDDPDGLARAIHGVVEDWPIPDREILREVLRGGRRRLSLKEHLREIPDVGTDEDFARVQDKGRRTAL